MKSSFVAESGSESSWLFSLDIKFLLSASSLLPVGRNMQNVRQAGMLCCIEEEIMTWKQLPKLATAHFSNIKAIQSFIRRRMLSIC